MQKVVLMCYWNILNQQIKKLYNEKLYRMIPTQIKDDNYETYVGLNEPTGYNRKKVWKQHSLKNLFNGNVLGTTTVANVTATPNGSKITFNGTTNANTVNIYTTQYLCNLKAGTYILSATVESGTASNDYSISLRNSDGSKIENDGTSFTLANDQPVYFRFYVATNGTVFNNLVLKFQLEKGNTATTYENYVDDKEYILDNNVYEPFEPQNEVYNLGETRIGTWIDGKPLYRKMIHVNNVLVNNAYTKLLGTSNVNEIISSTFIYMNKDNSGYYTGKVWYDNDGILVMYNTLENTDIKFCFRWTGFCRCNQQ